jgi:hypothetical protein
LSGSVVTVNNCLIAFNLAQSSGSGSAQGGAIANLLDASTSVSSSIVTLNQASGGSGPALGGGAYNDATSSLSLTSCLVTLNAANGSPGIGGGVYTLGTFSKDAMTFIIGNFASTSGNNIGP